MALASLIIMAVMAGCGPERLETGYEPRKLGASDATRRGFYAPEFSPAAQAAAAAEDRDGAYDPVPTGRRGMGGRQ
jgi:hypothetical protein